MAGTTGGAGPSRYEAAGGIEFRGSAEADQGLQNLRYAGIINPGIEFPVGKSPRSPSRMERCSPPPEFRPPKTG